MSDELWLEKLFWFIIGLFIASILSILYRELIVWSILLSAIILFVITFRLIQRRKFTTQTFIPRSKHFKEMQKIQKKRQKSNQDKHNIISDQINYIEVHWGCTKSQKKVIESFLDQRAYINTYNKLNGSLLPQLNTMIDQCLKQEQKGCKRAVTKRIREMVELMREELKKHKIEEKDRLETTMKVYDHLLKESR